MATPREPCAHPRCKCSIDPQHAVRYADKSFCSQRCADERGCDHHGCNCGVFPTQEPAPLRP